jgi:glucarate dehydratase
VHQPFALRAIIQLDTDAGLVGLGETYADTRHLARLEAAADAIVGLDVFGLSQIRAAVADRLRGDDAAVGTAGMITSASAVDQVFSPFEVACLDAQGHAAGRPVSDLLGGKARDTVPFSAYLFYRWAAHPGGAPDSWGEALDPVGIVAQAKRMIGEYGFSAIKLKGGVFPPDEEMKAVEALREAFPHHPLRLDPNAAWTPQTSVKVAAGLEGILEYLEDPTPDLDGMAEVAAQAPMPLARTGRGRPKTSSSQACWRSAPVRLPCRPRRGWASRSTKTHSARCTSSTSGAASATVTTRATCRASIPNTRRSARAGS